MDKPVLYIKKFHGFRMFFPWLHFVLFGFRSALPLHPGHLPSNHSYSYASSSKRLACFAITSLNFEPFMQYAGLLSCYGSTARLEGYAVPDSLP